MALAATDQTQMRPRILMPGLARFAPGTERYRVAGGGSVTVPVFAGDKVVLIDLEGGQPAEVVMLTADGREDPGLMGAEDDGPAEGIRTIVDQGREDAARLLDALKQRGLEPAFAKSAHCFGRQTPAFEQVELSVEGDGILIVAAPGADMTVDSHHPPTALDLIVERADKKTSGRSRPARAPCRRALRDQNSRRRSPRL